MEKREGREVKSRMFWGSIDRIWERERGAIFLEQTIAWPMG